MRTVRPSAYLALVMTLLTAGCGGAVVDDDGSTSEALGFRGKKNARIAVVGAGPSGLTAAYQLKQLGYQNVTVFDRNPYVGGKVLSLHQGTRTTELGAVFASPDYTLILDLAKKFNIPTQVNTTPQLIQNEAGQKLTPQEFLLSRYPLPTILAATVAYGAALVLFSGENRNGFAWQLPDLYLPMDKFAAKYGFTPIAKLMPWLVKLGGPSGLQSATYYTFPTGFQSLWQAVGATLNVKLNSNVTKITRNLLSSNPVHLVVNGTDNYDFDVVIISAPLNKVPSFVELSSAEKQLFSQVVVERYVVTLFTAAGLPLNEVDFLYPNAVASAINHASVYANNDATTPIYVAYQIVSPSLTPAQVTATLASDVATFGHGVYGQTLVQQTWDDYFPHVNQASLTQNFYEKVEGLQGWNNTFYVGATLAFETTEHSARYAQELVNKNFPPAIF